jgi:acyl-CoA thioester hydrolase
MISAEITVTAQFHDLDPMQVVWHGNYARYMEEARCALLDRIGYSYPEMDASGYVWPIVDLRIKYVRPVRFRQCVRVQATLVEWENRLRIGYLMRDAATGAKLTQATTIQVAVRSDTGEMQFESPPALQNKVKALL